jgi:GTPase
MTMAKPIVAIVGRPNVGKSTLFNKLIGERRAIVEDEPGTTRDRLYGETEWCGRTFTIIDTAGLLPGDDDPTLPLAEITRRTKEQAQLAIDEADAIVFLVDAKDGMTAADEEVAIMLRKTNKIVVLGANKAENEERRLNSVEFYNLGLGDPIPLTAYHGTGTGEILDALCEALPGEGEEEEEDNSLKIAIVGRPNVGKSSMLNKLAGVERTIVSNIPGTTRDTIDTLIRWQGQDVTLIDTAGIRKRGSIEQGIERYSVMRALRAIDRCDVALLLIDGKEGPTAQDTHVAEMVLEARKGLVLIVNKWDLVEKGNETFNEYTDFMRKFFHFVPWAPLLFISALTGQRIHQVIETSNLVNEERHKRVPTSELNNLLRDAVRDHPPASIHKGARLRLYYATQAQVAPPVFLFFSNAPHEVHFSYRRYLENRLREQYGYVGTPILVVLRGRDERRDAMKPKERRVEHPRG